MKMLPPAQAAGCAGLDQDFAHMQLGAAAQDLSYQRPFGSMLQPEALHSALGPPGLGMGMGMAPGYPEPTPNLFCQVCYCFNVPCLCSALAAVR